MEIKLYCIKSYTASALKNKLELMLSEHNLPYQVIEINKAEDFVNEGIPSIPAIRVKNTVITHEESSKIDDTVKKVLDVLQDESERYILVPVDFTPESVYALRYARLIASHLVMGVTIAHIHEPLFDPVTGTALDADIMKNNRKRLQEILMEIGWEQHLSRDHVPVTTHFDVGDVVTHVLQVLENDKYSFVIMSGHPESSFVKRLFGSVSTHVGRESLKPVIVVPQLSPLKIPKHYVVGLSDELLQGDSLKFLLDFAAGENVLLEFIHVTKDEGEFKNLKAVLTEKLKAFNTKDTQYQIISIAANDKEPDDLLIDISIQKNADMLVLATHQRNFIESIGHRSITRKILSHPVLPVMILHGHPDKGLGIVDYLYDVIKEG